MACNIHYERQTNSKFDRPYIKSATLSEKILIHYLLVVNLLNMFTVLFYVIPVLLIYQQQNQRNQEIRS